MYEVVYSNVFIPSIISREASSFRNPKMHVLHLAHIQIFSHENLPLSIPSLVCAKNNQYQSQKRAYRPNCYNKTANMDPAPNRASHVPATLFNAPAFVLEIGTRGPVLVAATTAAELKVLGAGTVELATV